MINRWIAISIGGLLCVAQGLFGCGSGTPGGNDSTGCVQQAGGTAGGVSLYGACAASCACGTEQTPLTSAQTAACTLPCAPYQEASGGVIGPLATCLSFDTKTFYCSKVCTSAADCPSGGTCAYGPVHQLDGIVVDPTMYCVKN